jgi:hypothetical protein
MGKFFAVYVDALEGMIKGVAIVVSVPISRTIYTHIKWMLVGLRFPRDASLIVKGF